MLGSITYSSTYDLVSRTVLDVVVVVVVLAVAAAAARACCCFFSLSRAVDEDEDEHDGGEVDEFDENGPTLPPPLLDTKSSPK